MSKVHIEVIIVLFLFTRYPMHGHEWAYLLWPVGKRIHLGKVAYYSQAKTETHIQKRSAAEERWIDGNEGRKRR
uniref:Secreted protein n=1 Tax=Xiphophorus couchianus TaxID=32473 RepID=A0A3B5KVB3_9TELE